MKRVVALCMTGGVLGIVLTSVIAQFAVVAWANGGSGWLLWTPALGLLPVLAFCALAAKVERREYEARWRAPEAPQWHVFDEELPDDRSPVELAMIDPVDRQFYNNMSVLTSPLPPRYWEDELLAGTPERPGNPHYHCSTLDPTPCPTGRHVNPAQHSGGE